jgi:hypothetical protein
MLIGKKCRDNRDPKNGEEYTIYSEPALDPDGDWLILVRKGNKLISIDPEYIDLVDEVLKSECNLEINEIDWFKRLKILELVAAQRGTVSPVLESMPTEGQFVAVWEYEGETWSGTYKIDNGIISQYLQDHDNWYEVGNIKQYFKTHSAKFIRKVL